MMTDCERLSDRMPEVARGQAAWTPSDSNHLARCASCQDEWQLVRTAATHGVAVGMRVDAAWIAERVARRVRNGPAAVPGRLFTLRRVAWPLAIAASLSVIVWGGLLQSNPIADGPTHVVAVLHELDGLNSEELEAMLDIVPESGTTGYRTIDTPESLGDLSAEELELLLSSMEG